MILGIAVLVLIALFFVFIFVIIFGAPYVPTLSRQRRIALDLLDLAEGQTLYELGSGDGSLLLEAAERGIKAVGYELNPILVLISRWRGRRYGNLVTVHWRNFWHADFAGADGIFIFQIDKSMKNLEAKIKREAKGPVKLVSHAFKIPGQRPAKRVGAILLYKY